MDLAIVVSIIGIIVGVGSVITLFWFWNRVSETELEVSHTKWVTRMKAQITATLTNLAKELSKAVERSLQSGQVVFSAAPEIVEMEKAFEVLRRHPNPVVRGIGGVGDALLDGVSGEEMCSLGRLSFYKTLLPSIQLLRNGLEGDLFQDTYKGLAKFSMAIATRPTDLKEEIAGSVDTLKRDIDSAMGPLSEHRPREAILQLEKWEDAWQHKSEDWRAFLVRADLLPLCVMAVRGVLSIYRESMDEVVPEHIISRDEHVADFLKEIRELLEHQERMPFEAQKVLSAYYDLLQRHW
jgi:hypothetical protein